MINIAKALRSFKYAALGIVYFFKMENNARIHLLISVFVITLGIILKLNQDQWLWIGLAICLVITSEMINTCFEKVVDLISPDFNLQAGKIKDLSAGFVLVTCFFAMVIGAIIFIPKLWPFITKIFT